MTTKRPFSAANPARRGPGRPPRELRADGPGPRERLLRSAAALFAAKGIAAVGLDELTKHAAVARMSLYQHFQNKEGLVAAYLRERHDAWIAWMKSEGAKFADPRERLLSIFDTLAAWHRMDDYYGCPFARAAGELGAGEGAVKDAMDEHAVEVTVWLESLSREAAHPRPSELAAKLVILINGANLCAARGGEHERSAALARSMVEMLLRESVG
jgi:AcrR family transcriptional regulator